MHHHRRSFSEILSSAIVLVLLVAVISSLARPLSTQPVELSATQMGFSTQTDQMNHLDIGDRLRQVDADRWLPFGRPPNDNETKTASGGGLVDLH
jgi:hypothetical protein